MLNDFINYITPYLIHLGEGTYFVVFLSAILETLIGFGFIFPGTTIIVIISFFSVQIGLKPDFLLLYAFLGNLIGSIGNYFLGHKYIKNKGIINSNIIEKSKNIINDHPIKSIVLGKLTPGLKESIPFVAGVMGINFYKFLIFSIIGTLIWVFAFVGIPYLFSYSLDVAQIWLDRFSYFILILFLIGVFFSLSKHFILKYGENILKFIKDYLNIISKFVLRQKIIANFIKNHPKVIEICKNRFRKDVFEGFTLTILSLLILSTVFSFLGLIENILNFDLIVGLDYRLASFFYAFRNDFLINIFLWFTYLGREYIIIGFFILISIYFYLEGKKNEIIALFTGIIGSIGFGYLLKVIFHHSRPEYAAYTENSYSFPSNHAIISVAFYGYLFWIFIRNTKKWKSKINYFFSGVILIFLIGFSRLYLGVHYLSDVLGGYLIGGIWLFFAIGLTEFLNIKYKENEAKKIILKGKNILFKLSFLVLFVIYFSSYNLLNPYVLNNSTTTSINDTNISNIDNIFSSSYLKYSQTFLGDNAENINFIFLAKDDKSLENIFNKSNWDNSDKLTYNSLKNISSNLLFQKPYNSAPITPIFWNNKTQDFSFQKLPDNKNIRFRHHIRVWKTDFNYEGYFVYVGVGVFDDGLKWYITHKIDPDINKEVEYIFSDLIKTNLIEKYSKISLVKPYKGENVFGDNFYSDGKAYLIKIK